jgi:co-chaperonin GroES (HSP10)
MTEATHKLAFEPHRIQRGQLRPLNDVVIVSDMVFDQRITNGGIIIPNDNGSTRGIRPRWAQVYAVGPDQQDVQVGDWVLVAHGRWTRGIDIEDESGKQTLRRVDPKDILLQSDEPMQDETWSDAIHIDKKPDHMLHS